MPGWRAGTWAGIGGGTVIVPTDTSLGDYTKLKTAIAGWLNRDDEDIIAAIPTFITLAEKEIARVVRRTSTRATLVISGESTPLPSAAVELRSVRLSTTDADADKPLFIGTPEILADYRARHAAVAGRPVAASIIAGQLVVAPAPDSAYFAEVVYFNALVPLSANNPTNLVLQEAPDAYLYGALMHAAPWLEHDERIEVWSMLFQKAIDQLEGVRAGEEEHASLRPIRLPYVFEGRV